jgi:hypothetical protein
MKLFKIVFVGSLLLLMSATPLLVATDVKENTNESPIDYFGDNSLGKITVVHVPLTYQWFKNHGFGSVTYTPPDGNPGYNYDFCEVDGKISNMSFTLTVEHRLNKVGTFHANRHTWINDLWIGKGTVDYFRIENMTLCYDEAFITYDVPLPENKQIVDLETNGEDVTLAFWLFGMPAVGDSKILWKILEIFPCYPINFLESVGGKIDITIHPIQC